MRRQLLPIRRKTDFLLAFAISFLSFEFLASACGPFFPNQLIVSGDAGVLAMPIGIFGSEIDKLKPLVSENLKSIPPKIDGKPQTVYDQSEDEDANDLRHAIKGASSNHDATEKLVAQYLTARNMANSTDPVVIPDALPEEFADYLRGYIAFVRKDDRAADAWNALLALPSNQRRHKTVWAAFMLGKMNLANNHPAQAVQWFQNTRALASAKFEDSLGLAASSLGWEAKAEMMRGDHIAAMKLYLRQYCSGDPTSMNSLRDCARDAFKDVNHLDLYAHDPISRGVITAYIFSNAGPYSQLTDKEIKLASVWLNAVETAKVADVSDADRLAWAAYRCGDFDSAARWAARAPETSAAGKWVRAKLLLRDGKINDAAKLLSQTVKDFPPDAKWATGMIQVDDWGSNAVETVGNQMPDLIDPIAGDLAVLQLTRGQYTDALDLLLHANFWTDGAYIAERVLTVDELKVLVDAHYPTPSVAAEIDPFNNNSSKNLANTPGAIRWLLARRLARLGRWKDAMNYFPDAERNLFTDYIADIRAGHDEKLPDSQRAAHLMSAARTARQQGMDLLGTELDPDFHLYEGQFTDSGAKGDLVNDERKLTAATDDERKRFDNNRPPDERRFSYRYTAADLAWSAIALMPDNSDQTAAAINEAGRWLKDRDPNFADKFYKALVSRCGETTLGKSAAAAKWFPKS